MDMEEIVEEVMSKLRDICKKAVGKRVRYKGNNGDEHDKENYGKPVEGEGICIDQHDSHGLCIMVQTDDGIVVCVDPGEVVIFSKYRSIDDE
jgi:hypothetical protein